MRKESVMKIIETKNAPAAVGSYSQAIVVGHTVYTSGQIPIDPITEQIKSNDISEQSEQAIRNLAAVLLAAGSDLDRVVKTTCFLNSMNDFAAFNEIYAKYFTKKPARNCVEVSALPKGALVEIDAIAIVSE